jgi:hypothetical protein
MFAQNRNSISHVGGVVDYQALDVRRNPCATYVEARRVGA